MFYPNSFNAAGKAIVKVAVLAGQFWPIAGY